MKILTFDVETTTKNKGHPFTPENKLVCLAYKWVGQEAIVEDMDEQATSGSGLHSRFTNILASADLVVGFNLKFDLHWIRRIGCDLDKIKSLWDVQLAYFMLNSQNRPYPSLNEVAADYGMGQKIDVIATEYWGQGIDTENIPKDVLHEYAAQDVVLTEQCFLHQTKLLGLNL